MDMLIKPHQLLRHLLCKREEEGFTLVELIVVVVIIGILSAIAVPSFQTASLKARQREASVIISTYMKAAQAYKAEYGLDARTAGDLKHYVSVNECTAVVDEIEACKSTTPQVVEDTSRKWITTNGSYMIQMYTEQGQSAGNRLFIWAAPHGSTSYVRNGYGVAGCFNATTGVVGIVDYTIPGQTPMNNEKC